jgi:DNA-binding Xre family transcriptional regulator
MKKHIAKYFWDLNDAALRETGRILKQPGHPEFSRRMVRFLSRCQAPKELFSVITRKQFIEAWPRVRRYWTRVDRESDFRDWWQTIYERMAAGERGKMSGPKGGSPAVFHKIGAEIRDARVRKGFSQSELALRTGIKQPDISKIEEGRKNITLGTLYRICAVLGMKKIELE